MKKTILALALVSCGATAVQAQDTLKNMNQNMGGVNQTMGTTNQTGNMQGTGTSDMQSTQTSLGTYNAYGPAVNVPSTTQSYLLRDYPTAMNATWEQSGDWYRANVMNNNRNLQVYYAPNGNSYTVALPVVHSWVPEEIITATMTRYANSVYSINKVKGANGKDMYQVTLLDGGMARPEYLSEDGSSTVAMMEVFRTDNMQLNPNTGSWENTSTNAAMGSDSSNLNGNMNNNNSQNWNSNQNNQNNINNSQNNRNNQNNNLNNQNNNRNNQNGNWNSNMDSTGTGVHGDASGNQSNNNMGSGTGNTSNMGSSTNANTTSGNTTTSGSTNTSGSTIGTQSQSTGSGMNPGTTNKTKKKTKRSTSSGTNQNQY